MRIRRKKHLTERLNNASDNLIIAPIDIPNVKEAIKDKKFLDFHTLFGNDANVEMEIGCGKGGFITELALKHPNVNYLAVELISNIIIMASDTAKEKKVKNVKFFNCGAEYLPRYIKDKSIDRIYLNFSPPFNGKRYENRRLTNPVLLENYKQFLKDDGEIIQKTDDREFFEYSLEKFRDCGFKVVDTSKTDKSEIKTEYEKKFIELGLSIYSLKAKK